MTSQARLLRLANVRTAVPPYQLSKDDIDPSLFDSPLPQKSFHAIYLASDNFSSLVFNYFKMHRPRQNHLP